MNRIAPDHRRFLLIDQGVGPTIFNFVLNAGIAWLMFRSAATVPMWGQSSIAGDTIATAFLLPFLTCLIVGKVVAHQVGQGRVRALPDRDLPASSLAFRKSYQKGLLLGVASVIVTAIPLVWALSQLGPSELARNHFILFKSIFAAILGGLVTPLIGWWALMNVSRTRAR
jgi:Fe2+ transport system protein B